MPHGTNLCISSSPVYTVDDIDVDIGEPFSKSEKLKETQQRGLDPAIANTGTVIVVTIMRL